MCGIFDAVLRQLNILLRLLAPAMASAPMFLFIFATLTSAVKGASPYLRAQAAPGAPVVLPETLSSVTVICTNGIVRVDLTNDEPDVSVLIQIGNGGPGCQTTGLLLEGFVPATSTSPASVTTSLDNTCGRQRTPRDDGSFFYEWDVTVTAQQAIDAAVVGFIYKDIIKAQCEISTSTLSTLAVSPPPAITERPALFTSSPLAFKLVPVVQHTG